MSAAPTASAAAAAKAKASKATPAALRSSPLHVQLLLQMGSCHLSPEVMREADQVQKMLHSIMPEVDGAAVPAASQSASSAAALAGGGGATAAGKKKKKKAGNGGGGGGGNAAAAAATSSSAVAASASASASGSGSTSISASAAAAAADPSVPWSASSLARLAASTEASDLLLQALMFDPASPHVELRNTARAMQLYGLAAIKMPSTYACARLAHFFITGYDTSLPGAGKDISKGGKWLRMGAQRGHALCQYQLAYLLEEGMLHPASTPQPLEAMEFYAKAAELKYPPAMFNLATLLLAEDGAHEGIVEQDVYRAIRLMEDAAMLGDSSAQLKLGHLCFVGSSDLEIEASMPRCIQYLTMAAHNPHDPSVDAAKVLGIIYSTEDSESYHNAHYDLDKSIRYLRMAADTGHPDSQARLEAAVKKALKVKAAQVLAPESEHEKAMRLLSLQEGVPMVSPAGASASDEDEEDQEEDADSAAAAAAIMSAPLTSTPSADSLLLALTRLHFRFPELGASKLHAKLKAEYAHWELSEKRVKRVVKEQGWVPAPQGGAAASVAASAEVAPSVLAESVLQVAGRQRVGDHVVNDLD